MEFLILAVSPVLIVEEAVFIELPLEQEWVGHVTNEVHVGTLIVFYFMGCTTITGMIWNLEGIKLLLHVNWLRSVVLFIGFYMGNELRL